MSKIFLNYKEEAKKVIIDAAITVAIRDGYQAMTIEDVAKEVGVTKGALYGYFQNKEELMSEVLIEISKKIEENLNLSHVEGSFDAILDQLSNKILEDPQIPIISELISISGRDPAMHQMVSRMMDHTIQFLENDLRTLQEQKSIPGTLDLHAAAIVTEALSRGMSTKLSITREPEEIRTLWQSAMKKLVGLPVEQPEAGISTQ
jgi:AcrR family transcriptional regulator